jgi:uncharacterized protein (DUF58 family)
MARSRASLTSRGAGALFGALAVLLLAFYTTNVLLFLVAAFFLGFVIAELLAFAVTTRGFGPESFSAERVECSALVAVGGAGLVSVRATSRMTGGFYAEVHDRRPVPLTILQGEADLTTWWGAGETIVLAYVVSPSLRGLFDVGPTVVVAHDPLGLAFKTAALHDPWTVEAIVQIPSAAIGHPPRLASAIVGQTSLSAPGAGSDFRGLREYEPSDEMRRIAWSKSGQGKLFVRVNERESQQDLVVLLDVGRGMAAGFGYETALEKAVDAASQVLRVAFDEGGRAGLLVYGGKTPTFVPPGRGSNHEFQVFRELTGAELRPDASSLATALADLRARLDRPTTLFVFGAITEDLAKLAPVVAGVRPAGHRVYAMLPEASHMYPDFEAPGPRTAMELLTEPETRRVERAAAALESAGAPVGFFGRDDAVGQVAALYARQAGAGRVR